MREYYLNRSTSTWHLEYKDWLGFKKFADKAHGALSPCTWLLLTATRKIGPGYSAEFWKPNSAGGYDDDSYHNHEWYNKCLDSSFTSETNLCKSPGYKRGKGLFNVGASDEDNRDASGEWERMSWWPEFKRQFRKTTPNTTEESDEDQFLAHHYHRYLLDTIGSRDSSDDSLIDVSTGGSVEVNGKIKKIDPYTKWCLVIFFLAKINFF
jgi:hypothetical protein